MLDSSLFIALYAGILAIPLMVYLKRQKRKEVLAREAAIKGEVFSDGPRGQHPHIDVTHCIGCQGCTSVCPEGDVLGMVGGKAAVVKAYRCIGHGMCAEACPVGAITMRTADPTLSADLPYLTPEFETSIRDLFIAGELGGLALIRNAVRQGRDCIDVIAQRLAGEDSIPGVFDVVIVGAGPAGISAALRSIELGLGYLVIERETIGGTVTKYPRQKLIMTTPIEFPLYGQLKEMTLSKEFLLSFWQRIGEREDFRARLNEPVEHIEQAGGLFTVKTAIDSYPARAVVLAIGRGGTPRKLGVPGEDLPKVMYRLIEAEHYAHKKILVVGGGDSAVEAAIGLAMQAGNAVTLSYRREAFVRIKERNAQKLDELRRKGKINAILGSIPTEIRKDSVMLDVGGATEELPNDFVWVFAGGVAPNEFLRRIGIGFGSQDLTAEASKEALLASETDKRVATA